MQLEFVVEGSPVSKGRPRFTRAGFAFTPKKTRDEEKRVKAYLPMGEALKGPLEVCIRFLMPIPQSWSKKKKQQALIGEIRPTTKPDLDNLVKLIGDAMNGVVYEDDSQVVSMRIEKWYGDEPRTEVKVAQISNQDESE